MSTVTASHSPSRVPSRSSSPRLSAASVRRPKMMRSTATAPSLVTSYASRNDLAAQQTSRAAMILNRFASHGESMSQQSLRRSLSSARRSASPKQHHLSGHEVSNDEVFPKDGESADSGYCGAYFSFPSFEIFEQGQKNKIDDDTEVDLESSAAKGSG